MNPVNPKIQKLVPSKFKGTRKHCNVYTEEEAAEKACCDARKLKPIVKCIASKCMGWIWENSQSDKGYCGRAFSKDAITNINKG